VPFENEAVNECWISDRDRFSYEGLAVDRLNEPMMKGADGQWHAASWGDALQAVAQGLKKVREEEGADRIGALASETATLEELSLLTRVMQGLGSSHIDARARLLDPKWDQALSGVPWLGTAIDTIAQHDRVLVVGAFLRADHPLMTQRLRQAAKTGTQVNAIDTAGDDPLLPLTARMTVAPRNLPIHWHRSPWLWPRSKRCRLPPPFQGLRFRCQHCKWRRA